MNKDIDVKRFFSYKEGPFITHIKELENGDVIESRETIANYNHRIRRPRREYQSNKTLDKYTKYNDQIRTTDVWNMYDN